MTVSTRVPDTPPLIAVIVTVPSRSAVARPVADTVATVSSLDDHVTGRVGTGVPRVSMTLADSWSV